MNQHGMRRLAAASLLALGISIGVKGALDATYAAPLSQAQATAAPASTATIADFRSINMTAARVGADMVVNLTATGFPARNGLVVTLAVPSGGGDLQVATGTTDAGGSAALTFKMPATWPNGAPVSENSVLVTVRAVDGSVAQAATLTFYRTAPATSPTSSPTARVTASPTARATTPVAATPTRQATPSPVGTATIANFRSINMTAAQVGADMVVNLTATGFPARTTLVVTLAVPNGGGELQVATGTTDARGSAALTFKMPTSWPNGAPVSENSVLVTVKTADGSVKVAATLTFVRAGR